MPLIINGETIDPQLIIAEINRLRPDYQRVFADQSREQQEKQLAEWARENVIERVLLQQAARKQIVISDADVKKKYQGLIDEHGGEAAMLKNTGLNKTDISKLKADVRLQLQTEKLIQQLNNEVPKPTQEALNSYYNAHKNSFIIPEQVHAAHIVKHIDGNTTAEQAKQVMASIAEQINAGKTFEEMASSNSDCPEQAGDLGYFPRGQMVEAFDDVVFKLQPGEVSPVFQTEFGFHIAKVYDQRPQQLIPFEQVTSQIEYKLHEEMQTRHLETYIDKLKASAEIVEFDTKVESAQPAQTHQSKSLASDQSRPKKLLNSILIKPAGPDCNMACNYCFYLDKVRLFPDNAVHRMADDVLEATIGQAMQQSGTEMSFAWQGGEPTLMGLDFYRKAVDLQQKYGQGKVVGNGLQTNGILLDQQWTAFLKQHEFLVGLSIDGPEHVHDHYRHMHGGSGSWQKVSDRAKMLFDSDVAVNALAVVNNYSVQFPDEIYHYLKSAGFSFMQFIPCVEPAPLHPGKTTSFSVSPKQFGQFLQKLFDLWIADFESGQPTTSIRYFDSLFHSYVGLTPPECTLLPECGVYTVVEHNGDVYSCDFFVEPAWKLGNIMNDQLIDMLNSDQQRQFGQRKSDLADQCKACGWLHQCYGGCPKDRLGSGKQVSYLCDAFQSFLAYADPTFRNLARRWQHEQQQIQRQQQIRAAIQHGEMTVGRNDPCPCGSGKKFKKCCGVE
ncbi:anaerobic sulfatase maturase [candidate division KSB1 bacterium]|nr:anaerobic sulfatase maturase [candidate division KSB1 bacterium]